VGKPAEVSASVPLFHQGKGCPAPAKEKEAWQGGDSTKKTDPTSARRSTVTVIINERTGERSKRKSTRRLRRRRAGLVNQKGGRSGTASQERGRDLHKMTLGNLPPRKGEKRESRRGLRKEKRLYSLLPKPSGGDATNSCDHFRAGGKKRPRKLPLVYLATPSEITLLGSRSKRTLLHRRKTLLDCISRVDVLISRGASFITGGLDEGELKRNALENSYRSRKRSTGESGVVLIAVSPFEEVKTGGTSEKKSTKKERDGIAATRRGGSLQKVFPRKGSPQEQHLM